MHTIAFTLATEKFIAVSPLLGLFCSVLIRNNIVHSFCRVDLMIARFCKLREPLCYDVAHTCIVLIQRHGCWNLVIAIACVDC